MRNIFLTIAILSFSLPISAQDVNLDNKTKPDVEKEKVVDGYYQMTDLGNRKVVPYPAIRQADVAYRKRIWREIDFREKMNRVFAAPNANLMDVIVQAIQNGKLTAYDPTPTKENPTGDNFEKMAVLSIAEAMTRLGSDSILVEEFNENNEVISSHYENRPFNGDAVIKFRIKEDWIFDKQRSVFEPRIIGIAPLMTPELGAMLRQDPVNVINQTKNSSHIDPFDPFVVNSTESGTENEESDTMPLDSIAEDLRGNLAIQVDPTPIFWIYFPEARHVFVNKNVVNRNNAATGLTYDDLFVKRLFSSYIVKEDNPEDLRIKDYMSNDLDRLHESERIKNEIMNWEQDLWSY